MKAWTGTESLEKAWTGTESLDHESLDRHDVGIFLTEFVRFSYFLARERRLP